VTDSKWFIDLSLNEINFYNSIAPQLITLTIPKVYLATYNNKKGLIIMEAFDDNENISFSSKVNEEDLVRIITALAEFHAEWWNHPALKKDNKPHSLTWIKELNHELVIENFKSRLKTLIGKYGTENDKANSQELFDILELVLNRLSVPENNTIYHGDLVYNNLFIKESMPTGKREQIFLDFQMCGIGNGLVDMSHLLGSCGKFGKEPEHWLEIYHQTIRKYGVIEYTNERMMKDWKYAIFYTNLLFRSQQTMNYIREIAEDVKNDL